MSPQNHEKERFWPPKNPGYLPLKKPQKHVGLGGPHGNFFAQMENDFGASAIICP